MKIQVIYSSLSGNTEKLAKGIYDGLSLTDKDTKEIYNLKDGEPTLDGDVILFGYWVDRGGPNAEMKALLEKVEGKKVGIFATLGYFSGTHHSYTSLEAGVNLVKDKNKVIGGFIANGSISDKMIAMFRSNKMGGPHSATPENEIRWAVQKDHPTKAEIAEAAERFSERIEIVRRYEAQNLEFTSII